MDYTIIVNSESYDLPKKTIKVTKALDDALKVDTIKGLSLEERYKKLHALVKDILGEENAKAALGSEVLDEIDLSELSLIVLKINDSYNKPIDDYEREQKLRKINDLPLEKIVSVANVAGKVANMPHK